MIAFHSERLVARVVAGGTVVVLCAPPGFGKTEIIAGAARQLQQARAMRVVRDGSEVSSLGQAFPHDPQAPALFLIDGARSENRGAIADLLAGVGESYTGDRALVAIDELSDLPLSRLIVRGTVDLLDASVLRLRPNETTRVLRDRLGPKLRARIAGLAGDWPIALDLLSGWTSRVGKLSTGWTDLDLVREAGLGHFITENILPWFDPDQQRALVVASMLNDADLDILEELGCRDALTDLAYRAKGLIDRVDDRIVVNHALRVFLRDKAEFGDPSERRDLLVDMADRCSARGRIAEAAALARRAGATERIQDFARFHGALRIWIVNGFPVIKELVDNASTADIAGSTVLRMMECIVHLKAGRIRIAQDIYESLADQITADDPLARDLEIVRVTLMVYGCSLERTGDLELMKRFIAEQADDPALRTFLSTLSCVLNSQRGRFDTAMASLLDAHAQARRAHSRYNNMFLNLHEASIHIATGNLKQARTCVTEARRLWSHEFPEDIGVETVISALSALIEYESGRLTSARQAVRRSAYRMPDAEAWFDIYFAAYDAMMRLCMIDRGIAATIEVIEDECRKLAVQGLDRVVAVLAGIGLCLAGEARLSGETVTEPPHWAAIEPGETASWQEVETFTLSLAFEDHRAGRTAQAIDRLDKAARAAAAGGAQRSRLRHVLLLAVLAWIAGQGARAGHAMREAIAVASASGMRQVFTLVPDHILSDLLDAAAQAAALDETERRFAAMLSRRVHRSDASSSPLSAREGEILQHLSRGGSDKQLARQLDISEHGVRFHLKNIFKKLGVHDRLAAVSVARERGLLRDTYQIE